jgi:mannose-6-phosphate isomerase-like protein (cupin superfamily)
MKLLAYLVVGMTTVSAPAFAQTAGAPPAPTDKAVDFPLAALEAVARDITAKGLITQRVLDGGVFSINVRHIAGSETALQHGRITEVWVVREGSGTVATGGTLIDPVPGASPGEFSGRAIRGGVERVIKAGDLVFIPPGVPHGIKESTSITYLNIRFEARDRKEP